MTDIEQVTSLLKATVPITQKAQDEWKMFAPGFRSFALFDPKEVVQTRIIAGLLDPYGNHGQGDIFLRLFLKAIGEEEALQGSLDSTQIRLEHMTKSIESDRRRIDLLITLPTGRLIALESKARGADDQPDQIAHYLSELENLEPHDHVLIYLSPGKISPRNISEKKWNDWTTGAQPRVRRCKYDRLIEKWLGDCLKDCSPNARVLRGFLKDFQKYTSLEMEGGPLMMEKLVKEVATNILKSKTNLIASVSIHNTQDEVRRRLASGFTEALRRHFKAHPKEGWSASVSEDKGYFTLSLTGRGVTGFVPFFEIGPDEPRKNGITPWHQTIGTGVKGGGKKDVKKMKAKVLREIKAALPSGKIGDNCAMFQREFQRKNFEDVVCLLYDCPEVDLRRIADKMKRIAGVIEKAG